MIIGNNIQSEDQHIIKDQAKNTKCQKISPGGQAALPPPALACSPFRAAGPCCEALKGPLALAFKDLAVPLAPS